MAGWGHHETKKIEHPPFRARKKEFPGGSLVQYMERKGSLLWERHY